MVGEIATKAWFSNVFLAEIVCDVLGYKGELVFDPSKPDGTPRKLMNVGRLLSLGWKPRIGLQDGIRDAYEWFLKTR